MVTIPVARYAKDVINRSFIYLLNNDTMLVSDNFSDKIISKYKDEHYWGLGPDIISPNGVHQNLQYLLLKPQVTSKKKSSNLQSRQSLITWDYYL